MRVLPFTIQPSTAMDDLRQPLVKGEATGTAGGHGTADELETILSDDSVPYLRRLPSATWIELRLLFGLAGPAVFVYMINYLMSMSTQIFSGHLGNLELAAASLGNTGIQIFAYGLMVINIQYIHKTISKVTVIE